MQLSVKENGSSKTGGGASLSDLAPGESALLERIELPDDDARRLMELGFLPGQSVTAAHASPFGDPRVYRVDGAEIALRRDTARAMRVRVDSPSGD